MELSIWTHFVGTLLRAGHAASERTAKPYFEVAAGFAAGSESGGLRLSDARASEVPHSLRNFAPHGLSVPQDAQRASAIPAPETTREPKLPPRDGERCQRSLTFAVPEAPPAAPANRNLSHYSPAVANSPGTDDHRPRGLTMPRRNFANVEGNAGRAQK